MSNRLKFLAETIMMKLGVEERVCGRDRQVFIFRDFVIKLPIMTTWFDFVRGLRSNLVEVDTVKSYKGCCPEHLPLIKWSGLLGIVVVMERYRELPNDSDGRVELSQFLCDIRDKEDGNHSWIWDADSKTFNFGYDRNGVIHILDIGTMY